MSVRQVLLLSPGLSPSAPVYRRVVALLERFDCEVHRLALKQESLELVRETAFDLVVVGFPIASPSLAELLQAARADGAACRASPVLVVAATGSRAGAAAVASRDGDRVVALDDSDDEIEAALSEVLGAAARILTAIRVELDLDLPDGRERIGATTVNLSRSGMLVRASGGFPIGTRLRFVLRPPGRSRSIDGTGTIARCAVREQDRVAGFAVHFEELSAQAGRRLASLLEELGRQPK